MRTPRNRQVAVAAADRDAVAEVWRRELGLGEPFHDPLVDRWGRSSRVDDLDDGRRLLAANGLRSVLDVDHDDIRSTHVHPSDVGTAAFRSFHVVHGLTDLEVTW